MASTSGTAVSLNAVYDALATFMTSNGWTLLDTVSGTTRDQVFTSSGVGGTLNMIYRLTANNETTNPWKNPHSYQKVVPQIIARGYHAWDTGLDTGTNEYGMLDMILAGNTPSGGQTYYYARINSTYPMVGGTTPVYTPLTSRGNTPSVFWFDGRRRLGASDTNNSQVHWLLDGASPIGSSLTYTSATYATNTFTNKTVWVWDATTNKEYIYHLICNTTLSLQWQRYDIDANTVTYMAAPVWTAGQRPEGGELQWDGADTIYAIKGVNTTEFAKYTISTNTWTNLAAVPVSVAAINANTVARGTRTIYVPNSVTGFGEDVLYFRHNTGTTIYRYNVTANTWNTPITSPVTLANDVHLMWDNQRYMYVWNSTGALGSQMYRSDLTTAPGTFTNLGNVDNTTRNPMGAVMTNTPTASLRCSNVLGMKYWFVGDADSITAVVRIGDAPLSAKYYWFRMGKYVTNYKTSIMTLTNTATAGVRATVEVDSTAGYVANEKLTLFNSATGVSEQVVIYDILSATQFRVNTLVNTFPSGAKAGSDVVQHILTGDSGFGTTALLGTGFKPDFLRPWYYVHPDTDTVSRNITYSGRSTFMPLDFQIRNPLMTTAGTYPTTGSLPFANCEFLGRITNVYALPTQSYPGPQPEDIVVINGQNYMFFPQSETAWLAAPNNIGVVVGPF